MAVLVNDFTWKQTRDNIVIIVSLKGVVPKSVDILTYHSYIKANFKPFLFEAFLSHPVQDMSSKCIISDGILEFHLEKLEKNVFWNSLCVDLSKDEKQKAREEALLNVQKRTQHEKAAKQELLQKLQRKSVQQQIELETCEKKKVQEIRDTERFKAMKEMETWKSSNSQVADAPVSINCTEEIFTGKIKHSASSEDENQNDVDDINLTEDDLRPVPIPRSSGFIRVKFTPRAFPTPQRESQIEEEQIWLKKQAAAQHAVGFVADDLRPEECNPQWLKEKGDSFFKVGNYLGAISAYSHGIKLSKEMAALYVNRSAAHFAVGNLQRVIEDCSTALELMTPKVRLNEDSRAICHARRGASLCKIGMMTSGLADLKAALSIKPEDQKLHQDIENVKRKLEIFTKDSGDVSAE